MQWPLLMIIVILNAHITAAQGAGLRDIRIGKYEHFTRVVFELDAAVAPPEITTSAPGRLSVAFAESEPRLIRKIPDHRSALIDAIDLWQSGPVLTAALVFNVETFRFKWFALSDPNRIVLDVYPLAASAPSPQPTIPAAETSDIAETDTGTTFDQRTQPQPTTTVYETNTPASARTPASPTSPLPMTATAEPASTTDYKDVADSQIRIQTDTNDIGPTDSHNDTVDTNASFTHRLQFYLVIGLVVITVIILGLLVLMLLARHRLAKEATSIVNQRALQHQDERISTIDARIEKQLKYYDEI